MRISGTFRVLFFLLVTGLSASGQHTAPDRYPANLDLHIMPVALAHPDPSFRIGTELMTPGRWSYGFSIGIGGSPEPLTANLMKSDRRNDYKFLEIRPEIKYYWWQREDKGWYAAVEGVYATSSYVSNNSSYYVSFTEKIVFEKAGFRKNKVGAIAKMGIKFLVGDNLTLDLFSGIGPARTHISYTAVENPQSTSHDPFFEPEDFYPGKRWTGLFACGVKIGIRLWEPH